MDKMDRQLELDSRRYDNAVLFEKHFKEVHIPTIDRLIKVDGHYQILNCDCYYCKLSDK